MTGKPMDPYISLICIHCDFYKEGEDEELECAGYRILKAMLATGTISPDDVKDVLR